MAPVARRTWPAIKAEVIRRLKGLDAAGFDQRVEQWIFQALIDIGTTLRHFELEKSATAPAGPGANYATLPPSANIFIVIDAQLFDAGTGAFVKNLVSADARSLIARWDGGANPARPRNFGRLGNLIYFDVTPDAAYNCVMNVYLYPSPPDFTAGQVGVSPLGIDCDEYIIARALAHAWPEINRPDLGTAAEQKVEKWMQMQARPLLSGKELTDIKEAVRSGETAGGMQG